MMTSEDLSITDDIDALRLMASRLLLTRMHEEFSDDGSWSHLSITINFLAGLLGVAKEDSKTAQIHGLGVAIAKGDRRTCEWVITLLQR